MIENDTDLKKESKLKKGVTIILIVNVINLFFKLLTNFLMPKYLNVNSYADFKYFQLLVNYVGVLHLGYIDGIYIRFGGKKIEEVPKEEIKDSMISLIVLELIMTLIIIIVSLLIQDIILLISAIIIIPISITSYYKYLYQATGEFKQYGKIMNFSTIILFIMEMILIFLKVQNGYFFMAVYVVSTIIVWRIIENKNTVKYEKKIIPQKIIINECKNNIHNGFFVMVGNFASQLLTGMDRWFIKILMTAEAFAYYSFAVSVVSFLNVAITPFSITLYNFFCSVKDKNKITNIIGGISIFSTIIVAAAFPVKWILEVFLMEYNSSNKTLFYLFAAQIFTIVTMCIYVNLYKSTKNQKKYSLKMGIMILLGFLTNGIGFMVLKNKECFALATLVTSIIWLFMCERDFKDYSLPIKTKLYLLFEMISLIYLGFNYNSIIGMVCYCLITLVLIILFMRDEFKQLYSLIIKNDRTIIR